MNKLSTCVRLKHIPTGIAVRCQEQRSQLQNRVGALLHTVSALLSCSASEFACCMLRWWRMVRPCMMQ